MPNAMTTQKKILIFENSYALTNYFLRHWREWTTESARDHNYFSVAFSGGRSPVEFYCRLSNHNDFELWQKTHIFLADERFVPQDDENSNLKLIKDNLLNYLSLDAGQIHPVNTNVPNVNVAATEYAVELGKFFTPHDGDLPRFDLIILGVGEDGHTASLFSNGDGLREQTRYTVPVSLNYLKHERVSLTLSVINNARRVVFVVTGRAKARVIKDVLEGKAELPSALVKPHQGELIFLLDREAASQIQLKDPNAFTYEEEAIVVKI